MQSYAALQEAGDPEDGGVLIHVVESTRARWNHIEDLDSFFSRMYKYHQQHGFSCMMLQELLDLLKFCFVIFLTTFLLHCVNYPLLFGDQKLPNSTKVTVADVVYPPGTCTAHFGLFTWIGISTAALVWILRLFRGIYYMFHYWDIKQFFNTALNIADSDLDNLTWHEVQTKARVVQLEQQMCIHKKELTELDIYHRILRQQNYLVALANKRLLQPRLSIPLMGEVVYWTRGLRYNVQFLLFWGPWAPFQNHWHLREEYKKTNMRYELGNKFKRHVLWLALANLILSPLIFFWQILYTFFSHAEILKREPGSLGVRAWSLYGRLYLRHFNELEHELQARLNRAHRPATRYLSAFSSPMLTIIASNLAFIFGAILAVLLVLTVYDEDVLAVEHILTTITVLGACLAICRALIPDETLAWCPETLLSNVLAHTHYLPDGWRGQAHTVRVRKEFQQLFQYRIVGLLEELFSPLITPYILVKYIYPRAFEIVDFFRNFTVSVVGVGDVCSFAQMDIRKHGNPDWQETQAPTAVSQCTQAEDGKVELSLVHFTHTNPCWKPPSDAEQFIEAVQRESSVMVPQSSGDYMLQVDLNDSSTYGAPFRMEGPANSNPNNMSLSTLYLYDRHFRQVGNNRYQQQAVETTPLLLSN